MTLISYVVAAYNLGDALKRCVESIQKQTEKEIEIIIINDKSTDNTLDIAYQLCLNDPQGRTRCISHLRNLGLPAARNTGFDAAKGKYIWHVDGDDYLPSEEAASIASSALETNNILALKIPIFKETSETKFSQKWFKEKAINSSKCTVVNTAEIEKQFGHGGAFSIIYSKDFAHQFGIRNLEGVSIGEDQILCGQLLKKLPCIGLLNIPLYIYDMKGTSMMRTKWQLEKYLEDRFYFHFLNLIMMKNHWRRKWIYESRNNHVANNLTKRAHKDLNEIEYALIRHCYQYDHDYSDPRKFSVNISDEKFKEFYGNFVDIDSDLNARIFDEVFGDAEFFVMAGAHKTGSTYMQSLLNVNKYDMALSGILYINYRDFRATFLEDNKLNTMSVQKRKSELLKLCLPYLFRIPKKIIIFEENLIDKGQDYRNGDLSAAFACSKNGFSTGALELILDILPCESTMLTYCIRNFTDYIPSRYCEMLKWGTFAEFDDYIKNIFGDHKPSWMHLRRHLLFIAKKYKLKSTKFFGFEDIISNPKGFLEQLLNIRLVETIPFTHANEINFAHRRGPSSELVNFVFDYHKTTKNALSAQKLYKKLDRVQFGSTKFKPFAQQKFKNYCSSLDQLYEKEKKDITINSTDLSSTPRILDSKNHSVQNIVNLFRPISKTEAWYAFKEDSDSEDSQSILSDIKTDILNPYIQENKEGIADYYIRRKKLFASEDHGITAMIRVKNEEKNIERVLNNCLDIFDEIVVVDNGSIDNTVEIVKKIQKYNTTKVGIYLYIYPFNVARCGEENSLCPEDSVHSLAYFYNYALSKCSKTYVCKWDGDMIVTDSMKSKFLVFKNKILTMSKNPEATPIMASPVGTTVFKGIDRNYYYKADESESEIRIFRNSVDTMFVKDILWEKLFSTSDCIQVDSIEPIFIEYKDVSEDEFSHWKIGGLGMGMRKRRELENFNHIISLTKAGNIPNDDELKRYGFKLYPYDLEI